MKKKFTYISIVFIALFFSIYSFLPHFLSKYNTKKTFNELGLTTKELKYDNDYFEYVEGGEGPVIVFVHGFQSSKNFWVPYMKKLNKDYTIIAIDLPGHGNSSSPKDQKYDINSLAQTLSRFVEEKGLSDFHLVGSSMGGGVVSIYASEHPDKLKSLTLMNPLGIDRGLRSELQLLLENGKNLFFPSSLDEFDEMALYLTGKKINLNNYFKKYVLTQMNKRYFFFKKAFKELLSSTPLDNVLPKIETRSLIIIGKKDRIIHPDSFEYFVELMPNIKAVRIENGSHVFVDQSFEQASDSMQEFLKENS
ncbi:MAG: hypothetical protein A3F40_02145 [Chlamydiae bacterium RIFCSPHIGHO2_12_FULL_27_8]|nr:MAG: hypothetical protein A3F40_02145 [Chlamydiae bacterium RIFCSPHIGHO2_12_FULL_27_8]